MRTQQLEHLQTPAMRERVSKTLVFLRQEAKELDQLLRQTIQADAALAADFALLPACPAAARSWPPPCSPSCPSSARLDRRKVAALAGLAPVAKDSGLREHKRVIKGGRAQVRRALYMAAVACAQPTNQPAARPATHQLIARGKAPKLALIALMRNMLVTLNAMLKTKQAWKDRWFRAEVRQGRLAS